MTKVGTNGDGVARYDGKSLEYFKRKDGFPGYTVRVIVEYHQGNVWFGTERGLAKYDGKSFSTLTRRDGLAHDNIWTVTIDRQRTMWIGTLGGVSRFDGKKFTPFALPAGKRDPNRGVSSARIIHCIMEDSKGRMWFASNRGAFIYDGKSLTNLSKKGKMVCVTTR